MQTQVSILIVDDQPSNLDALEAVLDSPDYRLVRAQSAQECLLALLKENFAAIVLDIRMPGVNGIELAHIIKQRKRSEHIPILFLTAHLLDEQDILRGYGAGAVDYLSKPINSEILRSKIAVFVELHRKTIALAAANAALEAEIEQRQKAQEALGLANQELESRVTQRTADLSLANDALRESEGRYRQLVQALPTAVYTCDTQGRILLFNQAAVNLWGREPEEHDRWCGSSRLFRSDGSELPLDECPMALAVREGRAFTGMEIVIETPSGVRRTVSPYPEPMLDRSGVVIGAVNMLVDITDAKQAQEERAVLLQRERQAREDAERANRLKDEFLATVSHELRNPLHAVLGWAGLLRKSTVHDPKLAGGLEIIERNAKVQVQLISDLLDVSRITSGKLRLNIERMTLDRVVQDAIDTVQHAALAKGVQIHYDAEINGSKMQGDPRRVQQIVWNLLSNAVKFTPPGGRVKVRAEIKEALARVTVTDTGQGMAADFLPNLFNRFSQADSSTSRKQGGLGLGLAIARHLVELHGGRIEGESPGVDRGSTFRVEFPLDAGVPDGAAGTGRRRTRHRIEIAEPLEEARLDGLKVLVVDDEVDGREFVRQSLEDSGAEVLTAGSAQEGFQALLDSDPDVLVSDIGMPGEDGYRFIERVREAGNEIPAIAVTAFARASDRERALRSGYQMHLSKPLQTAELISALTALTRLHISSAPAELPMQPGRS